MMSLGKPRAQNSCPAGSGALSAAGAVPDRPFRTLPRRQGREHRARSSCSGAAPAAPSLPSRPPPLRARPPPSCGTGGARAPRGHEGRPPRGRVGRRAGRGEDARVVLGIGDRGARRCRGRQSPGHALRGQWRRRGRQGDRPPRPAGAEPPLRTALPPLPRPGSSRPPPPRARAPDWPLPPGRAAIGAGARGPRVRAQAGPLRARTVPYRHASPRSRGHVGVPREAAEDGVGAGPAQAPHHGGGRHRGFQRMQKARGNLRVSL
ncbi:translation initiation factor IF-2-like [Motacilla alba alba]|uniref:translation initiation factor IF-2-like n=1 Tax=Motacilla alba alba TaxID=1094192 RepID=UPI0018D504C9|nr:translation initiation factor IF-2-like [Motacilla alba alba]